MDLPRVDPLGLTEYPPDYQGRSRGRARAARAAAALLLVLFTATVVGTTVASLGGYCLTSGDDTRILAGAIAAANAAPPSVPAQPVPVLVELFTSEGCSSCPSADALLSRLLADQPVEGAMLIGLEEHVDYWNRLGWADPFSSAAHSARQRRYGSQLGTGRIYTPQMIVDGREEFVGSDRERAQRAIAEAARVRKPLAIELRVENVPGAASDSVTVRVNARPDHEAHDAAVPSTGEVFLALTQNGLASDVTRGENAHRHLRHDAVVRSLESVGRYSGRGDGSFTATRGLRIDGIWAKEALRVVAFVSDPASGRVLGAAASGLP